MRWQAYAVSIFLSLIGVGRMSPTLANQNVIEVTVTNYSQNKQSLVSASHFGLFPTELQPMQVVKVLVPNPYSSSSVQVDYRTQLGTGGCRFKAGHTTNSMGPVYHSTGEKYGTVIACSEYLSPKWSPPYNYKLSLTMHE